MMVFAKTPCTQTEGHLRDAIVAQREARDTSAQFDDPNLVSCAGLVPVMRLAQDCDLAGLVAEHLKVTVGVGANAHLKIPGIVAGMLAGADSIDDLDVLRHGGMGELFGGVRAPSTLGSFLRGFDWGNVRHLETVSRRLVAGLAAGTPLLADATVMAHLDIDSTQRRVYGHAKAGAGFGAAKVGGYTVRLRGLNPLLAAVSTPTCAPVLGRHPAARRDHRRAAPSPSWPRRSPPHAPPGSPGC